MKDYLNEQPSYQKSPLAFARVVLMVSLFISFFKLACRIELWHFHTEFLLLFPSALLKLIPSIGKGTFRCWKLPAPAHSRGQVMVFKPL